MTSSMRFFVFVFWFVCLYVFVKATQPSLTYQTNNKVIINAWYHPTSSEVETMGLA